MTDPTPPLDEYLAALPDRVVTRVGELTTTFLDTLAILLFAAAAGVGAYTAFGLWAALLAGGATIGICSVLAQHRANPRSPRPDPEVAPPLPGPEHPGNLHIAGR